MTAPSGQSHVRATPHRRHFGRRLLEVVCVFSPTLLSLVVDFSRRSDRLISLSGPYVLAYLGTLLEVGLLWTALLTLAARRRGLVRHVSAASFVVLFGLTSAVQGAFFQLFDIYATLDAHLHCRSLPWAIVATLPLGRTHLVARLLGSFALGVALVIAARRFVRPRRSRRIAAAVVFPLASLGLIAMPVSYRGLQAAAPEALYFHGLAGLVKERVGLTHLAQVRMQRRTPQSVPALVPKSPRNVLFILHESLRQEVTCPKDQAGPCKRPARFSTAEVPDRMVFGAMRANSSSTLISLSVLLSGVSPASDDATLYGAPLLFEYAQAAGYDSAYWTSQNVIYGNMRMFLQDAPASHLAFATNLAPEADFDVGAKDALLADRAIAEWGELREPFVAVTHFSNTHVPYLVSPNDTPYAPAADTDDPARVAELINYYKNAVFHTDRHVARLIRHVRASASGARTVIVFTSDHGEIFGEHHLPHGHTSSSFDNEILVPAWIDAPPQTLREEERAAIVGAAERATWHVDLHATLLDLMGLWDEPGLASFRSRMAGQPLTREARTSGPVAISNCNGLWHSALCNWGMMQGSRKVQLVAGLPGALCTDVAIDPLERSFLREEECADLVRVAERTFLR